MCPKMQIMVLLILLVNRIVMSELKTNKQGNKQTSLRAG